MATDTSVTQFFPLPGFDSSKTIQPHGAGGNGGSDIFAPVGTPVVSVVSGTVTSICKDTDPGCRHTGGNAIQIHGTDGLDYYYAHFRDIPLPGVGDKVNAGSVIGYVDTTGNARDNGSPPHLHIGIGHGISIGVGPAGGLGQNFDAVGLLNRLLKDPSANNPGIISGNKQNAPSISFVPNVPGFDSDHLKDILINLKAALTGGVDPFVWLGIVSKESTFNANAVGPPTRFGQACGYAQLLPCPGNLSPEQNAAQGVQTLKNKLNACNGDINCALDAYSGGGGQPYISDVLGRANAIKGANPALSAIDGNSVDPNSSDPGNISTGPSTGTEITDCQPIKLKLALPVVGFAGGDIEFPNLGCVINAAIHQSSEQLRAWWKNWQKEHIPNFAFFLAGGLLITIGLLMFVGATLFGVAREGLAAKGAANLAEKAAAAE
jgi:hypothetical protein